MLRRNLDTDLRESRERDECFCWPDSPQEILLSTQTGRCNNLEGAHTGTLSRHTQAHTGTLSRRAGKVTFIPPWKAKDLTIEFRSPSQTTGGGEEFKEEKLRNSSKILQLRLSCSHINFSFLSSLQFLSLPFLHWSPPAARSVVCQLNLK